MVYGGNDGFGEHGLVNKPEPIQEMVHPLCTFVFRHEPVLDQFALDIIAGACPEPCRGRSIIRVAEGENNEEPPPAKVESGNEMGGKHGLANGVRCMPSWEGLSMQVWQLTSTIKPAL